MTIKLHGTSAGQHSHGHSSQKIPGARLLVPSLGRPGVRILKFIKSKESLSCQNCRSQPEKAVLQTKTEILHTLEDVGMWCFSLVFHRGCLNSCSTLLLGVPRRIRGRRGRHPSVTRFKKDKSIVDHVWQTSTRQRGRRTSQNSRVLAGVLISADRKG